MANVFTRSDKRRIETSYHDLSHNFGGTYYPGLIYPVFAKKVIPGDTWQMASSPLLRSQPFVSPLMSNVYCDIRYFYCRNQLLWDNFDVYLTNSFKRGRGNVPPESVPIHPYIDYDTRSEDLSEFEYKAFYDYMYGAIDPGNEGLQFKGLDALPARMYNLVWNEYYSNENYDKLAPETTYDGSIAEAAGSYYKLLPACYKKDYFTSALPSPQRGDTVMLNANIIGRAGHLVAGDGSDFSDTGAWESDPVEFGIEGVPDDVKTHLGYNNGQSFFPAYLSGEGFGVSFDIRDIRKASAIQRFLERSAVNGNRYAEYMLSQFGVRIPDNSAYRPQYLGGGSSLVNYSPVEQNSASGSGQTPQGTLAGRGTMRGLMGMNHRWFFTEPGWIMALMVIRPEALYVGGVNRQMWTTQDRLEDYVVPGFQNIGMQAILQRELQAGTDNDAREIGYQERYMEYKTIPSSVHGELVGTMKSWFAIRDFTVAAEPYGVELGSDFMHVQTNAFDHNTAVQNYPPFVVDIHHSIGVRRPLQFHAKYGGTV